MKRSIWKESRAALAVSLDMGKRKVRKAVWVLGVNGPLKDAEMKPYFTLLKTVAAASGCPRTSETPRVEIIRW
jgi:hypothetical protein